MDGITLEKRFNAFMILFLILLLGGIYYLSRDPSSESYEAKEFLMDTFITINVHGSGSKDVIPDLLAKMRSLEEVLSRHVEDSDIYKLNQEAGITPVPVEEYTMEILLLAKEYGAMTNGAFDITISPLLTLWGFGEERQKVPDDSAIDSLLPLVDYSLLQLDEEEMTAFLPEEGMAVDLGGIAKGYIVDKGIDFLKERGVENALISAGGDISVLGERPSGGPWRIGIRDPFGSPDEHLGFILRLHNGSVDTSGSYERFFVEDERYYHHILHPDTGYPAPGVVSTTVFATSSAIADALSTALFVLGLERGEELILSLPGIEAMIITQENQIWMSPGFQRLIEGDS